MMQSKLALQAARLQPMIDAISSVAPLANRPNDERRPAVRIAGRKDAGHVGPVRAIGRNVAATIQLDAEIDEQLALNGTGKAHGEQYEVRLQLELGPGHWRVFSAPVGEAPPLQARRVKLLHTAVFARERSGGDAPISFGALLMRVTRTQLHRPQRPRRRRRAIARP